LSAALISLPVFEFKPLVEWPFVPGCLRGSPDRALGRMDSSKKKKKKKPRLLPVFAPWILSKILDFYPFFRRPGHRHLGGLSEVLLPAREHRFSGARECSILFVAILAQWRFDIVRSGSI
jgi:hypothetical protein